MIRQPFLLVILSKGAVMKKIFHKAKKSFKKLAKYSKQLFVGLSDGYSGEKNQKREQ